MLNELIKGIDAELLDKAVIAAKDADLDGSVELLEQIAMSFGIVANCRGLLGILDKDVELSLPQKSAIGFKMLEATMLGILLGANIALDKDAIENVELPEEAMDEIADHRTMVAAALAGKVKEYAD